MLKYNLTDNMSWGFSSIFLYESFDVTDAEQREATWQFINSWRKGGGEKRYGIPDTIPKKETAAEKAKRRLSSGSRKSQLPQ